MAVFNYGPGIKSIGAHNRRTVYANAGTALVNGLLSGLEKARQQQAAASLGAQAGLDPSVAKYVPLSDLIGLVQRRQAANTDERRFQQEYALKKSDSLASQQYHKDSLARQIASDQAENAYRTKSLELDSRRISQSGQHDLMMERQEAFSNKLNMEKLALESAKMRAANIAEMNKRSQEEDARDAFEQSTGLPRGLQGEVTPSVLSQILQLRGLIPTQPDKEAERFAAQQQALGGLDPELLSLLPQERRAAVMEQRGLIPPDPNAGLKGDVSAADLMLTLSPQTQQAIAEALHTTVEDAFKMLEHVPADALERDLRTGDFATGTKRGGAFDKVSDEELNAMLREIMGGK